VGVQGGRFRMLQITFLLVFFIILKIFILRILRYRCMNLRVRHNKSFLILMILLLWSVTLLLLGLFFTAIAVKLRILVFIFFEIKKGVVILVNLGESAISQLLILIALVLIVEMGSPVGFRLEFAEFEGGGVQHLNVGKILSKSLGEVLKFLGGICFRFSLLSCKRSIGQLHSFICYVFICMTH